MEKHPPLKIIGSVGPLLKRANPAVGSPWLIDFFATRQTPESQVDRADGAATAAQAGGGGSSAGADLRTRLGQVPTETPLPAPSRRRFRKLLLAGALGVSASGIHFGQGDPVWASDAAIVVNLPAVGEGRSGGVAGANAQASIGDTMMPREDDPGDASAATDRRALPDSTPKATERGNVTRVASTTAPQPPTTGARFEVGDKFKIAFYERIDDIEKNKWGRPGSALQGFQQRPELTGEYAVQDDGTISLPLLGSFVVADRSPGDLQAALANAFEKLTARKGFVTILSLERPPVYVLGPVKNAGSYKYVPGMTVLHTIALAGGFDRNNIEPWQRVEAVREVEKRRDAIEIMLKAVAREAVLKSERDGSAVKVTPQLLQLVSETEARKLIANEVERHAPIAAARRNRERALAASADAAKQEVQMLSNRLQPIDGLIKLREKRVVAMRTLLRQGTINNLVMVQAQSELSDAEQRRQDAVNQYAMAQQRAALVEQEQAKLQADTRTDIETEIMAVEQQIAGNERVFATSDGVLGALRVTPAQYAPSTGVPRVPRYAYEIVRQRGSAGPIALPATGMTTLQPGDLVRVVRDDDPGRAGPEPSPQGASGSSAADAGRDPKSAAIPAHALGAR